MKRLGVVSGAIGWFGGMVQFFLLMALVQFAWTTPYSWAGNNISDLGNVHCGDFDGRYVCSPLHTLMNVSFTTGGILIILGAILTHDAWPRTVVARLIRSLLVATGAGWMTAGLFPADVNENLHVLGGAFVIFAGGNLALLLTVFLRTGPLAKLRWWGFAFGLLGLAAMLLHFSGNGLGLGVGGMERVTAYGLPIWLGLAGFRLFLTDPVDHERPGLVRR
ncbi:hypothetical protein GCM10029976_044240 [Kribbella albertanoniae]|uniref:DUF998 domain-containing protein n=1 Tax=Kribbella albertanoniae TaxID=1266829 RepID=A0A4R4PMN6_9ACTN|nr:DUF998 domain-containing protein [Kribbella albertanoniae]TDC23430.1 DUF998 domain-containing protein [Kribbella albertanoniae]